MMPLFPTHKVTVSRQTKPTSGFGASNPFSSVYTDLLCSIYEKGGNEAVIYGGDRSVAVGSARFFAGITLQEGDRIEATGEDPREITRVSVRRTTAGIPFSIDTEWKRVQA